MSTGVGNTGEMLWSGTAAVLFRAGVHQRRVELDRLAAGVGRVAGRVRELAASMDSLLGDDDS